MVDITIEQDVKRMFITKLRIEDGKLLIETEYSFKDLSNDLKEIEEKRQDFLYDLAIGEEKKAEFQKRVNEFFDNGFDFKLGYEEGEIIKNLGWPKKTEEGETPSIHDPEHPNLYRILFYDGLRIGILITSFGFKELITSIEVTSNKYKLKQGLNIGCSQKYVLDTLGKPRYVDKTNGSLVYYTYEDTHSYENKLSFHFKDNKLIKVEWDYYVD